VLEVEYKLLEITLPMGVYFHVTLQDCVASRHKSRIGGHASTWKRIEGAKLNPDGI
jgi:hypothetical protein